MEMSRDMRKKEHTHHGECSRKVFTKRNRYNTEIQWYIVLVPRWITRRISYQDQIRYLSSIYPIETLFVPIKFEELPILQLHWHLRWWYKLLLSRLNRIVNPSQTMLQTPSWTWIKQLVEHWLVPSLHLHQACTCVYMHIHTCAYNHIYTHAAYAYIYIIIYICICICIHTYNIYICIYTYAYIYIHMY